ncbi:hypothetical protein N0V82_005928 [Gnomoniopsis sp. IMI 355080]|nr:hypothetical protein N0V82_005928 [Gnomoniopsis sp. IMI 355080]
MVESFLANIHATAPASHLDICCIANGEQIPDLSDYRLVILSGGKVNLLDQDKPLWALQVLDMVRKVAGEPTGPKLLGICWGHQAIHYALGGDLAWVEDGPRIGVQDIRLTAKGQQIFSDNTLKMHKYHVRYISRLAPGFASLTESNEISISESDRIMTFQGHPEMTYEISKALSEGDNGTYKPSEKSEAASSRDELLHDISTPHDGGRVWEVIMDWATRDGKT